MAIKITRKERTEVSTLPAKRITRSAPKPPATSGNSNEDGWGDFVVPLDGPSAPATRAADERDFAMFFARLEAAAEIAGYADALGWADDAAKVSRQTMRNLRSQRKAPGLDILRRLSAASGHSINWWLGEDDASALSEDFVYVKRRARASETGKVEPLTFAFRRYWVEKYLKASPNDLEVLRIDDDLMAGTFDQGDNVLIHHGHLGEGRDGLYAVEIDGRLTIRRIQFLPGNVIRITHDNPKYPPIEVGSGAGFELIGTPRWVSRQL